MYSELTQGRHGGSSYHIAVGLRGQENRGNLKQHWRVGFTFGLVVQEKQIARRINPLRFRHWPSVKK